MKRQRRHASSRLLGGIASTSAIVLLASGAHAQGDDPAGAQFDLGLAAMKAEKYETACPAFAESYRLDPRPGVLFTLAECEAKWMKLTSALTHYDAYLAAHAQMKPDEQARQGRRAEIAQSQKAALDRDVPRLTIALATGVPTSTSVVLDKVALVPEKLGTRIALDPGEHLVIANLPNGRSDERRVTLAVREQRTLELGGGDAGPKPEPTADAPKKRSSLPLYGAIGIGVIGVGVGSVTGLLAAGKRDTINDHCDGTRCDAAGKTAADDAKGLATFSTIAFGVALVAGITTIVLIVTAPSSPKAASWRTFGTF